MAGRDEWPEPPRLNSLRLMLEPLQVRHAEEMAPLLDDLRLYAFIGVEPATLEELRERYGRQVVGCSPDGAQRWLNWVLRRREDERAIGTVQATVTGCGTDLTAEVAWMLGTAHQNQGYAREAARTMVTWLRQRGVGTIIAHVHRRHEASAAVATALGLSPTSTVVDGEVRWQA